MKKALITETTNKFVYGTRLLLKSFLHYNKFDGDILILDSNHLSLDNKKKLVDEFGVDFRGCSKAWKKVPASQFKGQRKWKHNPASRLQIFNLPDEYDRIYYFDSDIIITDDIGTFLSNEGDFVASAYTMNMLSDALAGSYSDDRAHLFNAGVLSISKKFLNKHTYDKLIALAIDRYWTGNQQILNHFFEKQCTLMSQWYNLTTDQVTSTNIEKAKVYHFVGNNKIWNAGSYISKFDPAIFKTIGIPYCMRLLQIYKDCCESIDMS